MLDPRSPARIAIALIAVTVLSCQMPTTTGAAPPDLGPAPDQIPADPLQIVTMQPGPTVLSDVHEDFFVSQPGYLAGSGRVDAVYPGNEGDLFMLVWQTNMVQMGTVCRAIAPPDAPPRGSACGSGVGSIPFTIGAYHQTFGSPQELMVEHSPDAEATVIELVDGSTFVIRPDGSSVSYHTWSGLPAVRFTIFWDNGTSSSEVLIP